MFGQNRVHFSIYRVKQRHLLRIGCFLFVEKDFQRCLKNYTNMHQIDRKINIGKCWLFLLLLKNSFRNSYMTGMLRQMYSEWRSKHLESATEYSIFYNFLIRDDMFVQCFQCQDAVYNMVSGGEKTSLKIYGVFYLYLKKHFVRNH